MKTKALAHCLLFAVVVVSLLTACARDFLGAMPTTPILEYPKAPLTNLRVRLAMPPEFSNYVYEQQMGLQLIRFRLGATLADSAEAMSRSIFTVVVVDPKDNSPTDATLTPAVKSLLWSGAGITQAVIDWVLTDSSNKIIWRSTIEGDGYFFGSSRDDMFKEVFLNSFNAISKSAEIRQYAAEIRRAQAD